MNLSIWSRMATVQDLRRDYGDDRFITAGHRAAGPVTSRPWVSPMPSQKSADSAEWSDPDDPPERPADPLESADVFVGDAFVRWGRGRPRSGGAKEQINVHLDPDVIAKPGQAGSPRSIICSALDWG